MSSALKNASWKFLLYKKLAGSISLNYEDEIINKENIQLQLPQVCPSFDIFNFHTHSLKHNHKASQTPSSG